MTEIRKKLGWGIFYTAISKYSSVLFSIVIGAVLARLLSPEDFGIVAIVTIFVSFFSLLSDFGFGPAVVQNQFLSDDDIRSIFSTSLLLGCIFSCLFFLSAPYIATFYEKPELEKITRLLAISVFFFSVQVVPYALCQKKLQFKLIGIITIVIQIFTGSIAIFLAYRNFGYYALVIKSILDGFAAFAAYFILFPIKITLHIKQESLRKITRFSSFQFLFNFINYFSRNADSLLIGKHFPAAALGYYDKSYRLMAMPVANLTNVITPVLMPVLSEFQTDKKRIFSSYLKVIKFLATVGFPLSAFLFFSGKEIITIIYGDQWAQSIPIFKLLAITVGVQMILSSSGSIFQAINRTDLLFYSGISSAIFMISGISYGVFIGESLLAVAYGLIIAFSINFVVVFYVLVKLGLEDSFTRFLKSLVFPIVISFGVGILLSFFEIFGIENVYCSLGIKIVVSGLSFCSIYICHPDNRNKLKRLRKK